MIYELFVGQSIFEEDIMSAMELGLQFGGQLVVDSLMRVDLVVRSIYAAEIAARAFLELRPSVPFPGEPGHARMRVEDEAIVRFARVCAVSFVVFCGVNN